MLRAQLGISKWVTRLIRFNKHTGSFNEKPLHRKKNTVGFFLVFPLFLLMFNGVWDLFVFHSVSCSVVISGEAIRNSVEVDENLEKKFSATAEWSPCPARDVNPTAANGCGAKRKRSDTPGKHRKACQGGWISIIDNFKNVTRRRKVLAGSPPLWLYDGNVRASECHVFTSTVDLREVAFTSFINPVVSWPRAMPRGWIWKVY